MTASAARLRCMFPGFPQCRDAADGGPFCKDHAALSRRKAHVTTTSIPGRDGTPGTVHTLPPREERLRAGALARAFAEVDDLSPQDAWDGRDELLRAVATLQAEALDFARGVDNGPALRRAGRGVSSAADALARAERPRVQARMGGKARVAR